MNQEPEPSLTSITFQTKILKGKYQRGIKLYHFWLVAAFPARVKNSRKMRFVNKMNHLLN